MKTLVKQHLRKGRLVHKHSRVVKNKVGDKIDSEYYDWLKNKRRFLVTPSGEAYKESSGHLWSDDAMEKIIDQKLSKKMHMVKKSGLFNSVPKEKYYFDNTLNKNVFETTDKKKAARLYASDDSKVLVDEGKMIKVIG
jgi:hypothetical protein